MFSDARGHGQILCVAGAVAADKGQDDPGEDYVEDQGEEERDEEALGVAALGRFQEQAGLDLVIVLGSP